MNKAQCGCVPIHWPDHIGDDFFTIEWCPLHANAERWKRERDALLVLVKQDGATFRDFEKASRVLGRDTVAEAARIAAEANERLIAACEKEEPCKS